MSTASQDKVVIQLKAIGNAPILKQQIFKLSKQNEFSKITTFIQKELKQQQIFIYLNNFVPRQNDLIGDLFGLFGVDGVLLLNYSLQPAFG